MPAFIDLDKIPDKYLKSPHTNNYKYSPCIVTAVAFLISLVHYGW